MSEKEKTYRRLREFLEHERSGHRVSGNHQEVQEITDLLEDLKSLSPHSATKAVHEWIRDDAPTVIKMSMTPELTKRLVDRMCGNDE